MLEHPCGGCEYKEWRLEGVDGLHFAIEHWEDGGPSYFCKPTGQKCAPVLLVLPVVKGANGKLDYAYPRSIGDMPFKLVRGQVNVWATFDHEIDNVDYDCRPVPQQRLPVVLFEGVDKSPGHLRYYKFEPVALGLLVKRAKVSTAKARKLGWGCPPQAR